MTFTDWIGFFGVSILLLAFLLNLLKRISQDSLSYISLNLIGAIIACCASALLKYWPFIILEAVWAIVSAVALAQRLWKK